VAKRKPRDQEKTQSIPGRGVEPKDLLHFIELDEFTDDWESLGLSDDDLASLQLSIMTGSVRGAVIQGTGGARKLRFAPPSWSVGKSGAIRVISADFPKYHTVLLIMAYGKSEQDDLDEGDKAAIAELICQCEQVLSKHSK
jgi:hypothetical protein